PDPVRVMHLARLVKRHRRLRRLVGERDREECEDGEEKKALHATRQTHAAPLGDLRVRQAPKTQRARVRRTCGSTATMCSALSVVVTSSSAYTVIRPPLGLIAT